MELNQNVINFISLILATGGSIYAARLLYKQVFGKNQGDATKSLSDTVIDQNELIENLQARNSRQNTELEQLYDAREQWNSEKRHYGNALRYLVSRYKVYAPPSLHAQDLHQVAILLQGDSGPMTTTLKPKSK